jgi:nucleotide-binding universal stress UspA family protein
VTLVHVLEEIAPVSGLRRLISPPAAEELAEGERQRRSDAERMLADAALDLRGAAGRVEPSVVEGTPAPEILRMARRVDADLIVVGARGLGTLGRLLLGSVSEAVLLHARCPVVIVRQR